jgi:hypothetical protein
LVRIPFHLRDGDHDGHDHLSVHRRAGHRLSGHSYLVKGKKEEWSSIGKLSFSF